MRVLHQLWADQTGFVVSTELVLVATILVIGMVVGLATVRDAVVTELADVAAAIGSVNQSYIWTQVVGHSAATAGTEFQDNTDFCDSGDDVDPAGNSQCVVITGDDADIDEPGNPVPN